MVDPTAAGGGEPPPCSIIVPIKGASQFLASNIEAVARITPFRGEILLAAPRRDDPAVAVIEPKAYREARENLIRTAFRCMSPAISRFADCGSGNK